MDNERSVGGRRGLKAGQSGDKPGVFSWDFGVSFEARCFFPGAMTCRNLVFRFLTIVFVNIIVEQRADMPTRSVGCDGLKHSLLDSSNGQFAYDVPPPLNRG